MTRCHHARHLGIGCADLAASAAFYDTVLAPLGAHRLMDYGVAIGFGVPPKPGNNIEAVYHSPEEKD